MPLFSQAIHRFTNNVSKMKNLAAQDYEDMLQVRLLPAHVHQQTHHCSLSPSCPCNAPSCPGLFCCGHAPTSLPCPCNALVSHPSHHHACSPWSFSFLPFRCHLAVLLPLTQACPVAAMPPFLPCVTVSPLLLLHHTISAICHQVSVPSQRLKIFLVMTITNASSNYYTGLRNGMVLPNLDCTPGQYWTIWNHLQRNMVTS